MRPEVFRMERVTYKENGIERLSNCDLHIFSGEILGLIPLNSHGLPSLLDVITKNLPLEFGFIFLREKLINNWRYPHPQHNPIGLIQSQSQLVEGLSLADNVFVLRSGFGAWYIQSRLLRAQLVPFFEKIGIDVPLEEYPEELPTFQRIVVELIRAMVAGYRLMILYDISTFLSEAELEKLHGILRKCVQEGFSFLYISSQPEDLSRIADRICIFENGRILKTLEKGAPIQEIVEKTAGFNRRAAQTPALEPDASTVLRVEGLSLDSMQQLSFDVHRGECVVLQDVNNRMTSPLLQILEGDRAPESGQIWLDNRICNPVGNRDIAVIQELPAQTMIFPRLSYFDNLFITSDHHLPHLWSNTQMQRRLAREYGARNGVELFDQPVESLSELEKIDLVYNRILLQKPRVVFCIRPFKGADMELREHIRQLMFQLRKKQIAVVLLTANADETYGIADRMIRA